VALRNEMQDVMNCMKKDGTIAKMSEKWFGKKPGPDALERGDHARLRRTRHARLRPDPACPEVQLVVEARGLHKHFGALHVLKGVDLLLAERELVFVIGPSGSGKSTLLRCLNRLEEPFVRQRAGRRRRSPRPRRPTSTMRASASAWCSSRSTSTRT
jgi:ABC-type glutathione transport system ATPase component